MTSTDTLAAIFTTEAVSLSTVAKLVEARAERDAAKAHYDAIAARGRFSSKAFRDAAEELDFWQGRVAFIMAQVTHDLSREG